MTNLFYDYFTITFIVVDLIEFLQILLLCVFFFIKIEINKLMGVTTKKLFLFAKTRPGETKINVTNLFYDYFSVTFAVVDLMQFI